MNPDASLFVGVAAGHDNAVHARHACGARGGSLDSAALLPAVCCAGSARRSLAHSRCCRGRSTGRSAPARSSVRRYTGARLHLPVCHRRTDVDEGPRWWDTAPANVPRHVVGRGADTNLQVGIGAAPVFNEDRHLTHLLLHSVQLHRGAAQRLWLLGQHLRDNAPSALPARGNGICRKADSSRIVLTPAVGQSERVAGGRPRWPERTRRSPVHGPSTLPTPMHRDRISARRPSRPQISCRHN